MRRASNQAHRPPRHPCPLDDRSQIWLGCAAACSVSGLTPGDKASKASCPTYQQLATPLYYRHTTLFPFSCCTAKSKQCTAQGKGSHLGRNPLFTLDRRAPGMACHLCVATHASIVTTHKRPCTHAHASKSPHTITQSRDTQIQSHPCLMCVRAHSLRAYGWGGEGKRKAGREGQREGRTLETAPSRHMWG